MTTQTPIDIPAKPRVLIADDSRIVRAMLIKHIEGMFEFREAVDGEHAWETLLLDPNIKVVITDLTMPRLDGYGLLGRIRSSKITRIRTIPVVVVSGSDEREERERAKAAGATDLITKGIATVQLLSRLDILAKLIGSQGEFQRSLEVLVQNVSTAGPTVLRSSDELKSQAETLLAGALKNKKDFVVLNVRVGLKHAALDGSPSCPPTAVVDAIGQLLQRIVRQNDCVAKTGEAEFTLVTGSISSDSARIFAQRVCQAIAGANLAKDEQMSFMATCGVASLSDCGDPAGATVDAVSAIAKRRAKLGLERAVTGVVGGEEEAAF
jgi:two-component system cell cycle response regulator